MSGVGKINVSIERGLSKNIENYTKKLLQERKSLSNNSAYSTNIEEFQLEDIGKETFAIQNEPGIIENIKDNIGDFLESTGDFFSETACDIGEGINSIVDKIDTGWNDIKDHWDQNIAPLVIEGGEQIGTFLERTSATIGTSATSIVEGVLGVGESLIDFLVLAGTTGATAITGIIDLGQALGGLLTGNDWDSLTKKMWDQTKDFVSIEGVKTAFDDMYENTAYGKWLKENSYAFDTVRGIGNGVGYTAGIVGLSILTFGGAGSILGGEVAIGSTQLAATAGGIGLSKGTESSWADGAGILEGLAYGGASGVWEGIQYFLGAKIGGLNLFGEGGKFLTNLGAEEIKTKIINSLGRVVLDGADGGIEGFIQPMLGSIYKDGNYSELFNEYGGWQNVLTQATVGSIMSSIGEGLPGMKDIIKKEEATVTLDLLTEDITQPLPTEKLQNSININEAEINTKVKSIIEDISSSYEYRLPEVTSIERLQKILKADDIDRFDVVRMLGFTDETAIYRIATNINNLGFDQINRYINENYVTIDSTRLEPVIYSKEKIKTILNDDREVSNIIFGVTKDYSTRCDRFEEMLDIAELEKAGKLELTPVEKENLNKILDHKPEYESKRQQRLKHELYFEKNYDNTTEKYCGYDLADVDKIVNYLSKHSPEDIEKYIATIPDTSMEALEELKMISKLRQFIKSCEIPIPQNLLENLNLLTEEYYRMISIKPAVAVSFDNRYGADQNVTDALFKNSDLSVRERLQNAILGKVDVNTEIKENLYRIVESYFPTIEKSQMKQYLSSINSTGACSYANVVNAIYNQFYGKEDLFKQIFGYDMYRIEDGKKLMNDQYLLTDLYTYINYDNESMFITDGITTEYIAKGDHSEQRYMSGSKNGIYSDKLENFINYKIKSQGLNMTAEVTGETPIVNKVREYRFKYIDKIRNIIAEGIEENNSMSIGVSVDHAENKEYTMYLYNANTGLYDKKFSSKNWVSSSLSKEFEQENRYGNHRMSITGIMTDGITVASWGKEFYIPFEQMHKIGMNISKIKINIKENE